MLIIDIKISSLARFSAGIPPNDTFDVSSPIDTRLPLRRLKKYDFSAAISDQADDALSTEAPSVKALVPAAEVPAAKVPAEIPLPKLSIDPEDPPVCLSCDGPVGPHDLRCTGPSIQYECSEHIHRECINADESTEEYRCPFCKERLLRQCRGAIDAGRYQPCNELYPQINQGRPLGWECDGCKKDTELYLSDIIETADECRNVALRSIELHRNDASGRAGELWNPAKYSYVPAKSYMSTTLLDSLGLEQKVELGLELPLAENTADTDANAFGEADDDESTDADDAEQIKLTKAMVGNRQAVYGPASTRYERLFYGSQADTINLVTSVPRRPTMQEEEELQRRRAQQTTNFTAPARLAADSSNYKLPDESSRPFTSDEEAMFCSLAQRNIVAAVSPHAWSRAIGTRSPAQILEEANSRKKAEKRNRKFKDANDVVLTKDQWKDWDGSISGAWDPQELDALRECISEFPPPIDSKNKPVLGAAYYRDILQRLQARNVQRNTRSICNKLYYQTKWKYDDENEKLLATFKGSNVPRTEAEHHAMVAKLNSVGPFEKAEICAAMRRAGSRNTSNANSKYIDVYMVRLNHSNFDAFMRILNVGNPVFYYCDHGGVGNRTYRKYKTSYAHSANDFRKSKSPHCICGLNWERHVGNAFPPGLGTKLFKSGLKNQFTHLRENGNQPGIV